MITIFDDYHAITKMKKEKIKKRLATAVVTSLVAGTMLMSSSRVWAINETIITIPELGDGFTRVCDVRDGEYNHVTAGCERVFPCSISATDNFNKIRVKLFKKEDGKFKTISKPSENGENTWVLEETKGCKKIYLKDNCMDVRNVYFGFCGNSPSHRARAIVRYDAK